jgi:hypothetical protein
MTLRWKRGTVPVTHNNYALIARLPARFGDISDTAARLLLLDLARL